MRPAHSWTQELHRSAGTRRHTNRQVPPPRTQDLRFLGLDIPIGNISIRDALECRRIARRQLEGPDWVFVVPLASIVARNDEKGIDPTAFLSFFDQEGNGRLSISDHRYAVFGRHAKKSYRKEE